MTLEGANLVDSSQKHEYISQDEVYQTELVFGELILNLSTGEVKCKLTNKILRKITKTPMNFIITLYKNNSLTVNKDELIVEVWGGYTSPENITQTVNKLRSMIDDREKKYIVNEPGKGYCLNFDTQYEVVKHKENCNKCNRYEGLIDCVKKVQNGSCHVKFYLITFITIISTFTFVQLFFVYKLFL